MPGTPIPDSRTWISWPQVTWFAALLTLLTGSDMLQDPDTYWHTAVGRWILEHQRIPATDPFSFSMPQTPWTAHEWLSEVVFSSVHDLAGWTGLVLLAGLCFAATLSILTHFLCHRLEPVHALILVGLTAGMMKTHLLARPHLLVAPLLAIWLYGLLLARERDRSPNPWLLLLIPLWANLHGSFTLAIGLAGVFALEACLASGAEWRKTVRPWAIFFLASIGAALFTPFHWQGLAFTGHIMSLQTMLANIGEWRSPNFQHFNMFEIWLLGLLALALSCRLKLPTLRILLLLGLIHLSLSHARYMAITGIVAPFIIAKGFAESWYAAPKLGNDANRLDTWFNYLKPPARYRSIALSILLSVSIVGMIARQAPFTPETGITPSAALDALAKNGRTSRILNAYNFGGFLIYSGIPVFIDGRADMYGDKHLEKYLNAVNLKSTEDLNKVLEEFAVTATLLPPDTPAIALLDLLPGWQRVHADKIAVAHIRKTSQ